MGGDSGTKQVINWQRLSRLESLQSRNLHALRYVPDSNRKQRKRAEIIMNPKKGTGTMLLDRRIHRRGYTCRTGCRGTSVVE